MGTKTKFSRHHILMIAMILLSTVITLFLSTQKINYHLDELLTYSLSNGTDYINIKPGETYELYGKHQESFLTPSGETRFNYQNVWKNQAEDVHPPFYYTIFHTISSFMPGEFTKYIGISINIFFNALIILLLYKFSMLITNSRKAAYLTSLFWAVNPGIMSDMMFIRMYIMTMFFCLLISYVHVKFMKDVTPSNSRFFLSLFLVSLGGALTHYYFIVFTFFVCALFVFYLLYKKQIKHLLMYVGTYILTILAVLGIFPSVYDHIFGGESRGQESMENLMNMGDYLGSIQGFWRIISNTLFGGVLLIAVFAIGILLIMISLRKRKIVKTDHDRQSVLDRPSIWNIVYLLTTCSLYFLLIAKIAVYSAERYMQPIYPIIILTFTALLYHAIQYFSKRAPVFIVSAALVLISINGYVNTTNFEYLRLQSEEAIELAEKYSDKDSIVIFDRVWKIPASYVELSNYKTVTFYDKSKLNPLYQNTDYDEFVLYVHGEAAPIVKDIVNKLPQIISYKKLSSYAYTDVYYLQ